MCKPCNKQQTPETLKPSGKRIYIDLCFSKPEGSNTLDMLTFPCAQQNLYRNSVYIRVYPEKKIIFKNFNFEHSFFEDCAMRNVEFEDCNFTDCKFKNCDFKGSTFKNCKLWYTKFESTYIYKEILDDSGPREENLKFKLARNLRKNYFELGLLEEESFALNKELEAQRIYLYKSWTGEKPYYHKKYQGIKKIYKFFSWLFFKFNQLIWGHGENFSRCLISILAFLFFCNAIISIANNGTDFFQNFKYILMYFIGSETNIIFGEWLATILTLFRMISFGLLLAIIIKKLSSR